jgi:hypothetical protein
VQTSSTSSKVEIKSYDKAIHDGLLETNGVVLHEEKVDDNNAIVLHTSFKSLAVGYVTNTQYGWTWQRITPFYAFNSEKSPYGAGCIDVKLPNDKIYYLAMGKIFNLKVESLSL